MKKVKIEEVQKIEPTRKEVEEKLLRLIKKYPEHVANKDFGGAWVERWRKLFSAPIYICPVCGRKVGYVRTDKEGYVLGCDFCLNIQGYA